VFIHNIDPELYERLKKRAEAEHKSLERFARDMVRDEFKTKEEIWTAAAQLRAQIGKASGDSTTDIREDRDNDEPYR
jgi:plasmid stability protein